MKCITGLKLWAVAAALPPAVMAGFQYLNVPDLPPSYDSPDLPPGKPLVGDAVVFWALVLLGGLTEK